MSVADQIKLLSNTAPDFADSDDDLTTAQLVSGAVDSDGEEEGVRSRLRTQAAALMDDEDARYHGKRITRRSMESDEELEPSSDDDVIEGDESDENEDGSEGDEVGMRMAAVMRLGEGHEDDESGDSEDGASDEDDDEDEEDGDDGNEEEEEEEDEGIELRTKGEGNKDVEKGKAARAQIGLWDSLMEIRMKMRRIQTLVNRLPPGGITDPPGGADLHEERRQAEKSLLTLCNELMFVQTCLLLQFPDTRHVVGGQAAQQQQQQQKRGSDDEITSESEGEEGAGAGGRLNLRGVKRTLEPASYPDFLHKRHTDFKQFRNASVQKWSEKTSLTSGKVKPSFGAFHTSTLKQIDQILSDKDRLIKRTQLNRSNVAIIGDVTNTDDVTGGDAKPRETPSHTEIFDDDDFYHQLLRDVIERKSAQAGDPVAMSRRWLEVTRGKVKVKRDVDTKASKGRKIRYNVQSKLVNFMAPLDTTTWSDEQRDELFKSLYGHRFAAIMDR